jgi:hypothetical protein
MKKSLKRRKEDLHCFVDGEKRQGIHSDLRGDCSGLRATAPT